MIVSAEEWREAHEAFLAKEKSMTDALDELAAERRRLPAVEVDKAYSFEGPDSSTDLAGLFDNRRQLIVYHHMLQPDDETPCAGCCMFVDNVGHLAHLHARNTSLVLVSRAPSDQISAFRTRMGWNIPWYSTTDEFNADFDVTSGFGLNIFLRDGDRIYRTYFTTARGVESLGSNWSFLDRTPLGRQEEWEKAPPGVVQQKPYQWWRLHDEYNDGESG